MAQKEISSISIKILSRLCPFAQHPIDHLLPIFICKIDGDGFCTLPQLFHALPRSNTSLGCILLAGGLYLRIYFWWRGGIGKSFLCAHCCGLMCITWGGGGGFRIHYRFRGGHLNVHKCLIVWTIIFKSGGFWLMIINSRGFSFHFG